MTAETEKCPTCGTTAIHFDPPIAIREAPACGVVKPGTYANPPGGVPTCEDAAGHDGDHTYIVEYLDQWSDA